MAEIVAASACRTRRIFPPCCARRSAMRGGTALCRNRGARRRSLARCADHLHRRSLQYILPGQFPDLRRRYRGGDLGSQRPDADAALQVAVPPRSRRISARPRLHAASILRWSRISRSITPPWCRCISYAAHENPGGADLHQRARAAAAGRAALLRARRGGRAAIEAWPQRLRVAVIGSGSFLSKSADPKSRRASAPARPIRMDQARADLMQQVRIDDLIDEAPPRACCRPAISAANCSTDRHARRHRRPQAALIAPQNDHGHAFGVWRWN